jgi:hypothetical protein
MPLTVGRFNEELIQAGVLVAAKGLDDHSQGVVVDFGAEAPASRSSRRTRSGSPRNGCGVSGPAGSDARGCRKPAGRRLGPYGLQSAIAACHATAPTAQETDREQIVLLHEALGRPALSPFVELNRAGRAAAEGGGAAMSRPSSGGTTRASPPWIGSPAPSPPAEGGALTFD